MTIHDYLTEAATRLQGVHESMLNALVESQKGPEDAWICSSDFSELNALAAKLDDLCARYAPAYHQPTFAELVEAGKNQPMYRVLPEHRDLWSNDPDWDGIVTAAEIERLAREWGVTVEELMQQVEDLP